MLNAIKLSKSYKSGKVLDAVSISLEPGKISGLLGRNGAGKTTLFKILCGLITPDDGAVQHNSKKAKPIGAVIEEPGLYTYLNAYENLKLFAQIQAAPADRTSLENYLTQVGLPLDRKDPVRNFSMGMKQRLGIAIALLNAPDILILDEPFSGLDPTGVASLIQLIKTLAQQNIAILVSSHLMAELQKSCDYLYVIDQGKIVNQGPTQTLLNALISVYTLTGTAIEKAQCLQPYLMQAEANTVTINCEHIPVSVVLRSTLEEGFEVHSCVPNISLEQLIIPLNV